MGGSIDLYNAELQEYSCIIRNKQNVIFRSKDNGVKPLLRFYETYGKSFEPITVIDRIMGKGAILLAVLCGAKKVVTPVISEPGLLFAHQYGILVDYEKVTPYIINRKKDGQCPVEKCVMNIQDIQLGYQAIKNKLEELMAVEP